MLNVIVNRRELLKAIHIVENAVKENKIREVYQEYTLRRKKIR